VNTAEQAAAHGGLAIGRAVLLDRIRAAAEVDSLTGVANRRAFDAALTLAVERADGYGDGFGLLMIDLDHFKRLNDQHGHLVGDEVLRIAAHRIRAECRESDLAARYGGEEFAVIIDTADETQVLAVAERIRAAVATADTPVPVTASLGVARYPADAGTGAELVAAADAALYVAKADGRNRVELHRPYLRAA
jgi:diguanylate cyclase (GGDEF)-like protein